MARANLKLGMFNGSFGSTLVGHAANSQEDSPVQHMAHDCRWQHACQGSDVWAHCMELQQAFSGVNVRLLCGRMDLLFQRAVVESSMALYGSSDALICMLRAVSVRVKPPPWSQYIHMVPNVLSSHARFHK